MQKLSAEEMAKLVSTIRITKTQPIWNRVLSLQPGESLHVPVHEWQGKSNLVRAIKDRTRSHPDIDIKGHTLPNGQGWVIERVS